MICLECLELINKEVTYLNLLKPNIDKICNTCFSKYIYIQELIVYPNNDSLVYLNILFDQIGNPLALMGFIKPYYIYYLKHKLTHTILYFDSFNKIIYNEIQNISLGNIYIIVLHNEYKKGEWLWW